jgi:hypothetical protein
MTITEIAEEAAERSRALDMIKARRSILAACGFAAITAGFQAEAAQTAIYRMPSMKAADLNGKRIQLPEGLPGDYTLVLIGFQREQQADIDSWIEGLGLKGSRMAWLEMPVIEDPGAAGRFFIDNGMRAGLPGEDVRAHVVTIYTNKDQFKSAMGIPSENVQAVVVDRKGRILFRAQGKFDPEQGARIRQLMK